MAEQHVLASCKKLQRISLIAWPHVSKMYGTKTVASPANMILASLARMGDNHVTPAINTSQAWPVWSARVAQRQRPKKKVCVAEERDYFRDLKLATVSAS